MKWAEFRAAQRTSVLVLVAEDVVQTPVPHHVIRFPPRYPLCRLAPVEDPAIPVADVQPFVQRVQDYICKGKVHVHDGTPPIRVRQRQAAWLLQVTAG